MLGTDLIHWEAKQGKADGTSMNCTTFAQLTCDIHIEGKHNYVATPENNTLQIGDSFIRAKANMER